MAFNNLSGTVMAPAIFQAPKNGILSGNLSTSDGSQIINIPRVSNATDNSLITNVGGDANSLVCESNLLFNGNTLNITGDLTASVGVMAPMFYGDGRNVTNIVPDNIVAAASQNSIQFHNPIGGGLTGSSTLLFQDDVLKLSAGLKLNRTIVSTMYTASAADYYIGVNSVGGTLSLRLPDASTLSNGQTYVIKDEGGTSNINSITVLASGSQTIDGQNQVVLESAYAALSLYCNGTNKYFIC